MNYKLNLLAAASLMSLATAASATLIGDSVEATLSNTNGDPNVIVTPFQSTQVVGAGTEFTGNWDFNGTGFYGTGVFDQNWLIELDISDSSFSVTTTQIASGGDNISSGGLFDITLSDLDWVNAPGMITDVSSSLLNPLGVSGIGFSADEITVSWNRLPDSPSVYEFTITAEHVPEPGTLALFGLGLAGLGFARRKKA